MRDQLFRFVIAGGVNTVATYAIYLVLIYLINPYQSYIVSFFSGFFISYFLNLRFAFRERHSVSKAVLYVFVFVFQFFLGIAALHISLKAGVPEQFAALFAIAVSVPVKFIATRFVMTKKHDSAVAALLLSVAVFAVSVAAAYGALFAGELFSHGLLFNSDYSGPYLMWKDIFSGEVSLGSLFKEWNFQKVSAPQVFTDFLFFFAVFPLAGGDFAAGIHTFGILTIVLNCAGWTFLTGFVFFRNRSRQAVVLLLSALACVFLAYGSADLFGIMLLTHTRFSTFAFLPFCILMFLSACSGTAVKRLFLSFALAAVCSAIIYSDPVFTVWFVMPAFAAGVLLFFLKNKSKSPVAPMLAVAAGFVCARFWGKLFVEPDNVTIHFSGLGKPEYIAGALSDIVTWTAEAALRHPFLTVVWAVFFVFLFRCIFRDFSRAGNPALLFVRMFFVLSPAASVVAPVLTGTFFIELLPESPSALRYFIPAVFIPLFTGWAFVPFPLRLPLRPETAVVATAVLLTAISVPHLLSLNRHITAFSHYNPPVARCFNENARRLNLKKGVASYWWAKSLMATSDTGVEIAHVSRLADSRGRFQMYPFLFGVKKSFYDGPFDFVIANAEKYRPDQDRCMGAGPGRCRAFSVKRDLMETYLLPSGFVAAYFRQTPSETFECGGAQILVFK